MASSEFTNKEIHEALQDGLYILAKNHLGSHVLYRCRSHPHIPDVMSIDGDRTWGLSFRFANSMTTNRDEILAILNEAEALLHISGEL